MKRQRTTSINKHQWQDGWTVALLLVLLFCNSALFSNPSARNAPATTGSGAATIDKLSYQYYNQQYSNGRNTNRLRRVTDAVATSGYETDLRSQTAEDNYRYDAVGNLQQDKQEEIAAISWTLSGKIAAVERVAGSLKPDLRFEYDALGNRTAKYLTPKHNDGTPNAALCMATFYVRDAQGNIMATYTKQGDAATQLDEQPIYGSSRLGVFRGSAATQGIVRGSRVYEASNHLGNVLLTFSDRKVAVGDGSYKADVTSASDYYAFGMTALGRSFTGQGYRFGFNGKEHDKEITNDDYDFGARIYDARIGRWLSVDKYFVKYPDVSPFSYSLNNPIFLTDPSGDTVTVTVSNFNVGTTKINLFAAGEVSKTVVQRTQTVSVYQVTVTNESGNCATFYYTREAYRSDPKNPTADPENVTFDVVNDGDSFQGKIKSRWKGSDNVLELRKFDDENNQTVDALKNGVAASRTAIQFHLKGATDGCQMAVGSSQFETTTSTIDNTDISTTSSASQTNFMNKVKSFRDEDVAAGKSNFIKVTFEKMANSDTNTSTNEATQSPSSTQTSNE